MQSHLYVPYHNPFLVVLSLPDPHFLLLVLTARTAWIQADTNRYSGANKCTLWKAFASRGLGVNAASHKDDTSVPSGC